MSGSDFTPEALAQAIRSRGNYSTTGAQTQPAVTGATNAPGLTGGDPNAGKAGGGFPGPVKGRPRVPDSGKRIDVPRPNLLNPRGQF